MSVDELMPRARQAWADGARSKNALRKNLRVAWDRADEVFSRLSAEEQQERARKHRERRAALTQLRGRKRPGRTLPARRGVLPAAPLSPGMGPVDPWQYAVPARAAEEVPASPVVPLPDAAAEPVPAQAGRVPRWPLLLLALPAFVAIWSGWVGLGGLTGFGVVHPLPGIRDSWSLNTAITLPIGLETYGTYALYVWLSGAVPARARRFAMWSAIGSLTLGAAGQVAYHLMAAAGYTVAPWQITTVVACLPVAVLGMGAALYHLVHTDEKEI
jgi:hypothetical protein